MLNDHLDDDVIQEYVYGFLSPLDRKSAETHLATCTTCSDQVQHYKDIFEALEEDHGFELSKHFTNRVLRKTHRQAMGTLQFGLLQLFFIVAGFIVTINVMLNYMEIEKLESTLETTGSALTQFVPPLVQYFSNMISGVHTQNLYIALIVVAITALLLFDRFVLKPRFRASSMS